MDESIEHNEERMTIIRSNVRRLYIVIHPELELRVFASPRLASPFVLYNTVSTMHDNTIHLHST